MNRCAVTTRHVPAAVALVGVAVVAACSSSSGAGTKASGAASSTGSRPGGGTGGAGGFARGVAPSASGEIAAITGTTLQVQSTTQQTAVTYTSSTRITQQKSTTLSAIKVGSCITAGAATPVPGSSSTSSAPTSPPTSITATRVQLLAASANGRCSGAVQGGGAFPRPTGSGLPTGARTRSPGAGGGAGPRGAFADRVTGKVTAISGSTLTVQAVTFSRGSSSSAATASPSTSARTVHVTSATTYSTTAAATSSALRVGLCAVVQGTANSAGTVAARGIELSPKTGTTCATGFGGRLGGGGPGAGSGTGGQGGN